MHFSDIRWVIRPEDRLSPSFSSSRFSTFPNPEDEKKPLGFFDVKHQISFVSKTLNQNLKKNFSLTANPVFPGNAGLPEDPEQEIHTYHGPVRIRDGKNEIATNHIRVFPSLERTVKTKSFQLADKISP